MFRKRPPYYDEELSYRPLQEGKVEGASEISQPPKYLEVGNSNPPSKIDDDIAKMTPKPYSLKESISIKGLTNSIFVLEEGQELISNILYEEDVCSKEVYIVKKGANLDLSSTVHRSRFSYINREFYVEEGAEVKTNLVGSSDFLEVSTSINLMGYRSRGYERSAFILKGKDSARFFSQLNHLGRSTEGDSHVRGVQAGSSTSAVEGMIKIFENGKGSNSYLNQYVLLTEEALSHTYPSLEIENDDVKASHSASVSTLDEEDIFYLMSRGIDMSNARKTLVNGFLSSAVDVSGDERFQKIIEEVVS